MPQSGGVLIDKEIPGFNSPQVSSILRFDQTPVDLNAGRIDLEIPLIDFHDRDFDFLISLKYNSAGFRPADLDNFVGMNWSLRPSWAIYRKVKGIPDDKREEIFSDAGIEEAIRGFLSLKSNPTNVNKAQIYDNPSVYAPLGKTGIPRIKDTNIEVSSDIYNFSFAGYSGYFTIDFNGVPQVVCTSGGNVAVDISSYNIMAYNPSTYTSKISLITDEGYIYVFGGSYSAVEYEALSWKDNDLPVSAYSIPRRPEITAFFISQVIAPNGRTLTFEYDTTLDNDFSHLHSNTYNLISYSTVLTDEARRCYQVKAYTAFVDNGFALIPPTDIIPYADITNVYFSIKKLGVLKKIYTTEQEQMVNFYYSPRSKDAFDNHPFYHPNSLIRLGGLGAILKLDSLVYNNFGMGGVARLEYIDNGRLFLNSVWNSKTGNYTFEYYNPTFVSPYTKDIDHWDYWNGLGSNNLLIPKMKLIDNEFGSEDFEFLSDDRKQASNSFDATCNMLRKVTFPTGGWVEYEYEQHDYSRKLIKTSAYQFNMQSKSEPSSPRAGGLRIYKIHYYDENIKRKTTTFLYKNAIDSQVSSGILTKFPRYVYVLHPKEVMENNVTYCITCCRSSIGYDHMLHDNDHIHYSYVIEIDSDLDLNNQTPHNGYKRIQFTDYYSNRDAMHPDEGNKIYKYMFDNYLTFSFPSWDVRDDFFFKNQFRESIDRSQERGKVKNERFYSATGDLVREIDYQYKGMPGNGELSFLPYTVYTNTPLFRIYSQVIKVLFYRYNLIKKETTDFIVPGKAIKTQELYDYNNEGTFLKGVTTIDSKGDSLKTKYYYLHDVPSRYDYSMILSYNITSPIVLKMAYKNDKLLYTVVNDYKLIDNTYRGSNRPRQMPVLRWSSVKYRDDGMEDIIDPTKEGHDISYREYDAYGNPLYVVERDIIHTVYLWDYDGHFPVAKIENATYEEVSANMSFDIKTLPFGGWAIYGYSNEINELREKLPNALVTTYSYDSDRKKMVSMKDPRGKFTYFSYDTRGHLKEIYSLDNGIKEILEAYEYNYPNQ